VPLTLLHFMSCYLGVQLKFYMQILSYMCKFVQILVKSYMNHTALLEDNE